jgi:sugar lactone lactonase YvrE
VRKVDGTTGVITTVAGNGDHGFGGDGGQATGAALAQPLGLALDEDGAKLYIADSYNSVVRQVDLNTGVITTLAGIGPGSTPTTPGEGDSGPATSAPLHAPSGVAVDADGHVFIADQPACRIRRVDADTGLISTVAGTSWGGFGGDEGPAVSALLDNPFDVDVDGQGNLYISDLNNLRVRRVDAAGRRWRFQ